MRPVLTHDEVAQFRAEICRVAETLFARHGVEGVTMRQIAAELGCSYTTAYRYFKSREEILTAVRVAAFHRFCAVIEQATNSSPHPRKSAYSVGQAYLNFALSNPDAYRMAFDLRQETAIDSAELSEALGRARKTMVAYVSPLIEQGILQGDAQVLGQMLWAAAHGLVMLRLAGIVSTDDALRQLHAQTMSALVRGAISRGSDTNGQTSVESVRPAPARKAAKRKS